MTSPLSGWVLAGGLLLSSPALQAAFLDGTMAPETAGIRFLVAAVVTWVGLSLLESLVQSTSGPPAPTERDPLALPPGRPGPPPGDSTP